MAVCFFNPTDVAMANDVDAAASEPVLPPSGALSGDSLATIALLQTSSLTTLVQQDIDWDQLCSLATDHKVVALFLRNLDKVCPSAIPDAFRRELKTQIQINIQGNLFLIDLIL